MSTINKYILSLFSTDLQTEYHSTLRFYSQLGETIRVPTPPQPGLRGLTLSSLAHHRLPSPTIPLLNHPTNFIK